GNGAVETVVARNGDVALFWMDLNGHPIPPAQVQLPSVAYTINGQVHAAAPRVVHDHFVAHFAAPPSALGAVVVPTATIRGEVFTDVVMPRPVVVAALPPAIVVGVAAPAVVVAPPVAPAVYIGVPPPAIVVGVPAPPAVVFGAPAPAVVVGGGF